MKSKEFSVGAPIEARCTSCRTITNHIIVAIAGGKPVKVECNSCKGQHLYRPAKVAKRPAAARATGAGKVTRSTGTRSSAQKSWAELLPEIQAQSSTVYSMDASYKAKAVIRHPVFGLGQVQRIVGLRKMEVLFEDSLKIMRCK
jgi:hypothetical protein